MEVGILVQNVELKGNLEIPKDSDSIVVFAHGTGSDGKSRENIFVASELNKLGVATLLFDLLSEKESKDSEKKFDIDLLTERLIAVTKWCLEGERTKGLKVGYLGTSTGAAAALSAAAYWGTKIKAVVSRGGRPDLAMDVLDLIESPTLLIVGGEDKKSIDFNRQAYQKIGCVKKTEVVPGATNLFEELGALEKVTELAGMWFSKYL